MSASAFHAAFPLPFPIALVTRPSLSLAFGNQATSVELISLRRHSKTVMRLTKYCLWAKSSLSRILAVKCFFAGTNSDGRGTLRLLPVVRFLSKRGCSSQRQNSRVPLQQILKLPLWSFHPSETLERKEAHEHRCRAFSGGEKTPRYSNVGVLSIRICPEVSFL